MIKVEQKYYWLLVIAAILVIIAFGIYLQSHAPSPSKYAEDLSTYLQVEEQDAEEWLNNNRFWERWRNDKLSTKDLEQLVALEQETYSVYIYQNDSLLFWSNNRILPYATTVNNSQNLNSTHVKLKNGHYEMIRRDLAEKLKIIVLIPIKYAYPLENEYLRNHFPGDKKIPKAIQISKTETKYPILNINGEAICYIKAVGGYKDYSNQNWLLLIYLIIAVCLLVFIQKAATALSKQISPITGFIFLIIALALLRGISIAFHLAERFSNLNLFSKSSVIDLAAAASLGDLLINAVLLLWIATFFHRYFSLPKLHLLSKYKAAPILLLLYLIVGSGVFGLGWVFKHLVLKSQLSFDFNNIFGLNEYSFLGVLGLILIMVAQFLTSHRLIEITKRLRSTILIRWGILAVAALIGTWLNVTNTLDFSLLFTLFFAIVYILMMDLFVRNPNLPYTWLVLWVGVFSAMFTYFVIEYEGAKELNERLIYASSLGHENDTEAEKSIKALETNILKDNFLKNILKTPFFPRKRIIDQIDKFYTWDSYLSNRYNYIVHTYNSRGLPIRGEKYSYSVLDEMIKNGTPVDNSSSLYFWRDSESRHQYISKLKIEPNNGNNTLALLLIEYRPKPIEANKVYYELLMDRRLKNQIPSDDYSYAIYRDKKLMEQKGSEYAAYQAYEVEKGLHSKLVKEKDKTHLYYQINEEKVVIVSKSKGDSWQPLSLFSYMFCLILLFLILLLISNVVFKILPEVFLIQFLGGSTLSNRIQLSIVSVIIISFIVIGWITVIYFQNSSEDYHEGRLQRKANAVLTAAEEEIMQHPKDSTFLPDMNVLSRIHKMDINLYDLNGELLHSSQPEVFNKGLLSNRMHPSAFYNLSIEKQKRHVQNENIGTLEYSAAYLPLQSKVIGKTVAYLGLPYYSRQLKLRQDIMDFMSTLLNAYVLMLLIAGFIAIIIANSITRPIAVIGSKLKAVQLGTKNEPLEWNSKDELGQLIREYNKMIEELEHSATLLAQSERETAWREMAKQVAHEIKNPLTPMKLSIQYLQHAYRSRPNDIGDMLERVSVTLIEQIDSLAKIASEFSNFAKMPKATNDVVYMNQLVNSVYELFSVHEGHIITLNLPLKDYFVFADKDRLVRVFNNLIKNAIQAIPNDRYGEIDVSLYSEDQEKIIISVFDNGVGIPDEKREAVFVPNFTTKSSGTGLGLAIAKNIVEGAGGRIYFKSEINIGTQFYVELPIYKSATLDT